MDNLKKEAIQRMEILGISPEVVKLFKDNGVICYSEKLSKEFSGILFELSNHSDWVERVKKFEKDTGYLVYHAALTHLSAGDILDLLYVSDKEDEWVNDRAELKYGYADIYAFNLSNEYFSEFGSAKYEPKNGGINKLQ